MPSPGSFRLTTVSSPYNGASNASEIHIPEGSVVVQIPQARLFFVESGGRPSDIRQAVLEDIIVVDKSARIDGLNDVNKNLNHNDRALEATNQLLNSRFNDLTIRKRSEIMASSPPGIDQGNRSNYYSPNPSHNGGPLPYQLASLAASPPTNISSNAHIGKVPSPLAKDSQIIAMQRSLQEQQQRLQSMMEEQLRRMEMVERREELLAARERESEEKHLQQQSELKRQIERLENRLATVATENEVLKVRLNSDAAARSTLPSAGRYGVADDFASNGQVIRDRLSREREDAVAQRLREVLHREDAVREAEHRQSSLGRSYPYTAAGKSSPYRTVPPSASGLIHDTSSYPYYNASPSATQRHQLRTGGMNATSSPLRYSPNVASQPARYFSGSDNTPNNNGRGNMEYGRTSYGNF